MADLELSRLLKTQEKRKLKPAPARDPIAASIGLAIPAESAGSGTSAVASPWTKVAESGSAMIVSSDGLFAIEYPTQVQYEDANLATITIINA